VQSLQSGMMSDPLGTMSRLLTGSGGLSPDALSTLFGPDLAQQMGLIGQAMQVANNTERIAADSVNMVTTI
jgi:hypothetical protein